MPVVGPTATDAFIKLHHKITMRTEIYRPKTENKYENKGLKEHFEVDEVLEFAVLKVRV